MRLLLEEVKLEVLLLFEVLAVVVVDMLREELDAKISGVPSSSSFVSLERVLE